MLRIIVCFLITILSLKASAQLIAEPEGQDTLVIEKVEETVKPRKSPAKASLLSAVIPGAGQIYNHKYWKLPIVYAGIGTSAYFIIDNRRQYLEFRDAYLSDINDIVGDSSTYAKQGINPDQLRAAADQYRQWMEYSYIAVGIVYVLQIVDAAVDAHLYYFDVSDDLTLHWRPQVFTTRQQGLYTGVTLNLRF